MSFELKSGASSDIATVDATSKAVRVTSYDATGRSLALHSKATFFASGFFTPVATPTDLVTIYGSATKTVRVLSVRIGTTNTAAGSQQFFLVKRSAVNTTGTFVAATVVQADAADAATTATSVGHYTANPGGLGTSLGNVNIKRVASPAAIPATWAAVVQDATIEMLDVAGQSQLAKFVALNGVAQGLAVNFGGVALVAGQTHVWSITWIEE